MTVSASVLVKIPLTQPFPLQEVASFLVTNRRSNPLIAGAIKLTGEHLLGSYSSQIGKLAGLEKPPMQTVLGVLVICLLAQVDVVVAVDGASIDMTCDETLAIRAESTDVSQYIERARAAVVSRLFRTKA